MNHLQKHFSACLIALAALFSMAPMAWAAPAPDLGAASGFSVLGGTAVTCTNSVITGDVGSGGAFTNTGCTITGGMPPATNTAAIAAGADLLTAYAALAPAAGDCDVTHTLGATIPVSVTLSPGVYCTDAALTGTDVVLTLDGQGDANAVWIFLIGTNPTGTGALTGTNFSVVMANDGQACNVFWRVAEAVTMTNSAFKGTILAGGTTGSITLTGGTLAGQALANVAVTMTDASVIGCDTLSGSPSCKRHHGHHGHHGHDKKDKKCNQGVGNGGEGCDPGNSNNNPYGTNDEDDDDKPGDPGREDNSDND